MNECSFIIGEKMIKNKEKGKKSNRAKVIFENLLKIKTKRLNRYILKIKDRFKHIACCLPKKNVNVDNQRMMYRTRIYFSGVLL